MSLSSKKSALAVRERIQFENLNSALAEWGYKWKNQQLIDIEANDDSLSEAEIISIELGDFSLEETKKFLAHKSRGAKYLGWQIWNNSTSYDIKKICSNWAALKEIRHWMTQQSVNDLKKMDLVVVSVDTERVEHIRFQPQKLLSIGVRFAWQAERFCSLYKEVCAEKRSWGSCYQPDHSAVFKLATTPNYNRLPIWVKKVLVNSYNPIQTNRVGNIWRLIDCAKTWKQAPALPKGIAEKVGQMSVRSRILAGMAWDKVNSGSLFLNHQDNYQKWDTTVSRAEIVARFWAHFKRLSNLSTLALIGEWFDNHAAYENWCQFRVLIEQSLGLPFEFLKDIWGSYKDATAEKIIEKMAGHLNSADVCEHYFGTRGKATQRAFAVCVGKNQWKWAKALAFGNPDLVQKYLALPNCIEFEPDAVNLLLAIGDAPALRMVSITTFKVRSEVKPVEKFHVKDSGYLWNNLQAKPELGRVRCWLSLHEDLARQFIKEQPDEALKIHPDWQPLNGLCALDGSWEIEIPYSTSLLKYWGEKLSHCVGGYGPKINKGDCVIFGVKADGIIKYTVEMCPGRGEKQNWYCNQFYGERNSSAPHKIKRAVLDALSQAIDIKL